MGLFGSIGAIIGGGKDKKSKASKDQERYYKEMARVAEQTRLGPGALSGDITRAYQNQLADPMYRGIYDDERSRYVNQAYDFLNQLAIQDQRARARGAPSAIGNPERRDEMRARTMARQNQTADSYAHSAARDFLNQLQGQSNQWGTTLGGVASGYGAAAGQANVANTNQRQVFSNNRDRSANIGAGIGSLVDGFMGASGGDQWVSDAIGNLFM